MKKTRRKIGYALLFAVSFGLMLACTSAVRASNDELSDIRSSQTASNDAVPAISPSSPHTLMVVETDAGSASQSLNRISGNIDPGWDVSGSDDSHFFKAADQKAPSPQALENEYNPDPYYQSDKNNR